VSLHNLDQKHKCFDLSVVLGDFRLEKKHVRLYEPVVINVGGSAPVRLVADRIGRNEVHGSLSRPQAKAAPASWRQTGSGSSTHSKALAAAAESRQPHGGFPTTTP
jgi:hypothetical protein